MNTSLGWAKPQVDAVDYGLSALGKFADRTPE
jgi:hypothetical protein